MLKLLMKFGLATIFLAGAALPAQAALFGACNHRLEAEAIRAGGGNMWYTDCDAQGQLILDGKIYQIFEYQTSGYGEVGLGVMEPGIAVDEQNFDHVLNVDLRGDGDNSHSAGLADYSKFIITITQGDDSGKKTILLSQKLSGKCLSSYNDKGEKISNALESCEGQGWSLHIMPNDNAH